MSKQFKYFLMATLLLISAKGQANLLTNSNPGKVFEKVQTYNKVQTSIRGTTEDLTLVGAEIRTKKIVVHINVYVGEFFKNETTQAMRLTFLRDVDSNRIMEAFKSSLEVNKVDIKAAPVEAFLKAVDKSGESVKNSTLIIMGFAKDETTDTVVFQNSKGQPTQIDGPKGFAQQIFSIWLGTPSDDGLIKLQKAIKK